MNAAIYARSSKERHDVSIPSQVEELKALARQKRDSIVRVFEDKAESAKTDERPAFQEMMALAKAKDCPFDRIYCYDTSRFSRRREHAAAYKTLLKKAGVDLVFLKLPKSDTYVDNIIEGIFEVFDEFHSQKSKSDGLRGMRQNARQGYRAGGAAPYGYRLVSAYSGMNREGGQVVKNKLEPDPETAPFAREYFERRALGESRGSILRDFNRRGVPGPRGGVWHHTGGLSMERNLEVYLGTAIWNRHAERLDGDYVGGKKYRPRSDWVVVEGAHEPLITPETAEKVRALRPDDGRGWYRPRESTYLLSGLLYCAACGERLTGDGGFYACAGRKRLDGDRCGISRVSQAMMEREILRVIKEEFIRPEFYADFIKSAREQMRRAKGRTGTALARLREAREKAERARARWVTVYEQEGPGWEMAPERIHALGQEIGGIDARLRELESGERVGGEVAFSDAFFRDLLDRFEETMTAGAIPEQRNLVREVIGKVELGPKLRRAGKPWEREVVIDLRLPASGGVKLASPGGFEPPLPA